MTDDDAEIPPRRDPIWTLAKGVRSATCHAQPHPLGLELVTTVDGEIVRTQVARSAENAQALADDWRAAFIGKGWRDA